MNRGNSLQRHSLERLPDDDVVVEGEVAVDVLQLLVEVEPAEDVARLSERGQHGSALDVRLCREGGRTVTNDKSPGPGVSAR